MKRGALLKVLKRNGCVFIKHGKNTICIYSREMEIPTKFPAILT
jgi:hypothetical protein